jgi:GMP synthase-like glutamine amidotransferase
MILLIQTNKDPLHFYEFVKPVEDILVKNKIKGFIKKYDCIKPRDLIKADKVIITGTSLKDNDFIDQIKKFNWIKEYNKPILGICAGMQIISLIYNSKIKSKTEIGFYKEKFTKEFLGLINEQEVYHLHNNYSTLPKDFTQFTNSKIPQAIKHNNKKIYGVLFHPEVRNKEIIKNFISI